MRYSSKTEIVCAILRELIIGGELSPSEPLRQRELAQRFGVSQTPVREALRTLQFEGLVLNDPHKGATVAGSRGGSVEDNAQIRAALEPLGARLAARVINQTQLASLERINDEMMQLDERDPRYPTLNREFHFTIYESAESPVLLSMMRLLWQSMPTAGPKVRRSQREATEQHSQLIQALSSGDAEVAAAITYEHILSPQHLNNEPGIPPDSSE